jgi:hypothetical protein
MVQEQQVPALSLLQRLLIDLLLSVQALLHELLSVRRRGQWKRGRTLNFAQCLLALPIQFHLLGHAARQWLGNRCRCDQHHEGGR